jgi:hypothetical protein
MLLRAKLCGDESLHDCGEDLTGALGDALHVSVALDVGIEWRLVGVADAGEGVQLAVEGSSVETFWVAEDADVERCVDVDLDEGTDALADLRTGGAVGRDGGDEDDGSVAGELACQLTQAADVFVAVGFGEAEVSVESAPKLIGVEDLDPIGLGAEGVGEGVAKGGFAGSA